jgi:hypothetical protein
MLILNAVLMVLIVAAIVSLLGWAILSDRARVTSLERRYFLRARRHAPARPATAGRRQYGKVYEGA